MERAHDTQIDNNTVIFTHASAYSNAIEYRWDTTSGLDVRNNLTNQNIQARNGASATSATNVSDVMAAWFADVSSGNLHLAACDQPSVVGAGTVLNCVSTDIDSETRGSANDIGADVCAAD